MAAAWATPLISGASLNERLREYSVNYAIPDLQKLPLNLSRCP